jgi:hypothetical protein
MPTAWLRTNISTRTFVPPIATQYPNSRIRERQAREMLAVVVGKTHEGKLQLEKAKFGTTTQELEVLRDWLRARRVEEVAMESAGQYHKPVWLHLEGCFGLLHLAQAQSNRGPKGRKRDFADALRLVKRFVSEDLILSYGPDAATGFVHTVGAFGDEPL